MGFYGFLLKLQYAQQKQFISHPKKYSRWKITNLPSFSDLMSYSGKCDLVGWDVVFESKGSQF